jgi:hypothetical protein
MFIHLSTRLYAQLYVCMCVCSCMKDEISLSLTNMILLEKEVTTFFFFGNWARSQFFHLN